MKTLKEWLLRSICLNIFILMSLCASVSNATETKAEAKSLTGQEILELLEGNTAVGDWMGTPYRQYFLDDGTTIYAQKGTRSTSGQWRINFQSNHYESIWDRGNWSGYGVSLIDDKYHWTQTGIEPQAFTVVEGEALLGE